MIFQRALWAVIALGAAFAAAASAVVAVVYAYYALLKGFVGPAGASGIVFATLAVLIAFGVLFAAAKAGGKNKKKGADKKRRLKAEAGSPLDRIMDMARERPVLAAAAAGAAGLLAWRNPTLVATLTAFLAGRDERRD